MLFSCRLSLNLAKNIEEKEEIVIKEGKQSELSWEREIGSCGTNLKSPQIPGNVVETKSLLSVLY